MSAAPRSDATVTIGGNTQKISLCLADSTATSASKPNGTGHTCHESTIAGRCAPARREEPEYRMKRSSRRSEGKAHRARPLRPFAMQMPNGFCTNVVQHARGRRARDDDTGSRFDSVTRSRANALQLPTPGYQLPTTPSCQRPRALNRELAVGNWEWLAVGSWALGVCINPATAGLMRLSASRRGSVVRQG